MLTEDNPSVRTARRYFEALHPRGLGAAERIELRHRAPGGAHPMRRVFVPTPREAAVLAVSFGEARDVYAGVAARLGEDGTKGGVHRVPALWADLDAKDGRTREGRLEQLMALPCRPSMLVRTGGGWHAYWFLGEPAEGQEELDLAERVMRRLATGLGSDPVHDRGRVMRVPGTFNHKYEEPCLASIEHLMPSLRYATDELRRMAEAMPGATDGASGAATAAAREVLGGAVLEGGRNVALASVAGSLRDRGLEAETIGVVLLEVNRLRCSPPLDDAEVLGIARSVAKYPAGQPRYPRSSARRIHYKREGR